MKIKRFNLQGQLKFKSFIYDNYEKTKSDTNGEALDFPAELLEDSSLMDEVNSVEIHKISLKNRFELGKYLSGLLKKVNAKNITNDSLLWDWLSAYYCFNYDLHKGKGTSPERFILQSHFFRAIRHLVRQPWIIYNFLGEESDWILLNPISEHSQFLEQMFKRSWIGQNKNAIRLCRKLYFDESKKKIKPGCTHANDGAILRLASELDQLNFIVDTWNMAEDKIISRLPSNEYKQWENN